MHKLDRRKAKINNNNKKDVRHSSHGVTRPRRQEIFFFPAGFAGSDHGRETVLKSLNHVYVFRIATYQNDIQRLQIYKLLKHQSRNAVTYNSCFNFTNIPWPPGTVCKLGPKDSLIRIREHTEFYIVYFTNLVRRR